VEFFIFSSKLRRLLRRLHYDVTARSKGCNLARHFFRCSQFAETWNVFIFRRHWCPPVVISIGNFLDVHRLVRGCGVLIIVPIFRASMNNVFLCGQLDPGK